MIHYVCSAYFRCLIQNVWWNVPPNAILSEHRSLSKPIPESRQVLHPHVISQNMLGFGFWCILFIYLCPLFDKKTWSRPWWKPRRDIPSISGATALASDIQHGWRSVMKVVIGCNWDLETYDPPKSSQVISSDLKSQVTCELKPQSPLWVRTTRCRCHILSTSSSADPHWPVQRLRCSDAVEWLVSLADCKLRKVYQVFTCFNMF